MSATTLLTPPRTPTAASSARTGARHQRRRLADLEVAILCGGRGVRIQRDIPHVPKPLVEIGGKPILWHILQMYAHAGVRKFVLCLGYKGQQIESLFTNAPGRGRSPYVPEHWTVRCEPTGLTTNTGGRIKRVAHAISQDVFFATYGDGLADLDLESLLAFHLRHGRIATITCVHPMSSFGFVKLGRANEVQAFQEKPRLHQWVNGGFFVFDRRIFDYLRDDDVLESDTFSRLAADRQLMAYRHHGFWTCMDTYKDHVVLNQLWREGTRPWARWLAAKEGR